MVAGLRDTHDDEANMLEAVPTGKLSRGYEIRPPEGQVIELTFHRKRDSGRVSVGETIYDIARDGWTGPFEMRQGDRVVARARKPGFFSRKLVVETDVGSYTLRPRWFGKTFDVTAGNDDRIVGEIRRTGAFTRKAEIELPDELSMPLQAFAFWLVVMMWNRVAAAAAS